VVLGDATDSGLLRYVDRMAPSHKVRSSYRQLFEIPFNSANKWAMTITECPGAAPAAHPARMLGRPAARCLLRKLAAPLQRRSPRRAGGTPQAPSRALPAAALQAPPTSTS
jgi:hypothetical protein